MLANPEREFVLLALWFMPLIMLTVVTIFNWWFIFALIGWAILFSLPFLAAHTILDFSDTHISFVHIKKVIDVAYSNISRVECSRNWDTVNGDYTYRIFLVDSPKIFKVKNKQFKDALLEHCDSIKFSYRDIY